MKFVPCFQFILYNPHINSLLHLSTDISESFRIKKVRLNSPSRQDSLLCQFSCGTIELEAYIRLSFVGFWEGNNEVNMLFPSPKLLAPQGVLLVKPFCTCLSGWLPRRWFFQNTPLILLFLHVSTDSGAKFAYPKPHYLCLAHTLSFHKGPARLKKTVCLSIEGRCWFFFKAEVAICHINISTTY